MKFLVFSLLIVSSLNAHAQIAACSSDQARQSVADQYKALASLPGPVKLSNIRLSNAVLTTDLEGNLLPYTVIARVSEKVSPGDGFPMSKSTYLTIHRIDNQTCAVLPESTPRFEANSLKKVAL